VDSSPVVKPTFPIAKILAVVAVILTVSFITFFSLKTSAGPDESMIDKAINDRVALIENLVSIDNHKADAAGGFLLPDSGEVEVAFGRFMNIKRQRNEFVLLTGIISAKAKKNVERELRHDLDALLPTNKFGLDSCMIQWKSGTDEAGREILLLRYLNLRPVTFELNRELEGEDQEHHEVAFKNNVRLVTARMSYSLSPADPRQYEVTIHALLPTETFVFHKVGSTWEVKSQK
jgi:hypothetical protein